jgi:hypothetical protein
MQDSLPTIENAANGTWLKILYGLSGSPFKANDILFLKHNIIIKYVTKKAANKYVFQPFKIIYNYPMQCITTPCPMGKTLVTMYYNETLKGSIKLQKGQYYFVDFYLIDKTTQEIKEGKSVWQFKATTIKKPKGFKI